MKLKKIKPTKHKIDITITANGVVDLLHEKHQVRACIHFDFYTLMAMDCWPEAVTDALLGTSEAVAQKMSKLYEDERKRINDKKS